MDDPGKKSGISVAAFPVAWRVEIVNDDKHRGFEYVRLELHFTQPTGADR